MHNMRQAAPVPRWHWGSPIINMTRRSQPSSPVCSGGKYRMYTQDVLRLAQELTFTVLLLGAIYYDLRFRIVPNSLIIVSFVVGLVCRSVEGVGSLVSTLVLTLAIAWPFYQGYKRGWMGGGDVKLAAAASLLAGETRAAAFFLAGAAAGGLASLATIASRNWRERLAIPPWQNRSAAEPAAMVPYAAAYSLGLLVLQIVLLIGGKG